MKKLGQRQKGTCHILLGPRMNFCYLNFYTGYKLYFKLFINYKYLLCIEQNK